MQRVSGNSQGLISTGSTRLDQLLGGGIRAGMLTDIYGESGSGKTQLCFTLAANCIKKNNGKVIFVDTAGTFRPERILEIGGSSDVLEGVTVLRAFGIGDQQNILKKIPEFEPHLLIVDSATSLFSVEYSGPARHLAVMKYLHELALFAIASRCAVVITNMIRAVPSPSADRSFADSGSQRNASYQREYMGSSVSILSHYKIRLEIVNSAASLFRAIIVQPPRQVPVEFTILREGVSNVVT